MTTLSPGQLPRAVHGLDYAAQISASGGLAPYTFSLDGGALPDGTALSVAGVLDSVPTVPGAAAFTVTATDDDGCTAIESFVVPVAHHDPVEIAA